MACENKGVPRSSSLELWSLPGLFFAVCCLMWLVKTVSYLKSDTSRLYSRKNDWKGAWKKRGSFRETDKDSCTVCASQHHRQAIELEKHTTNTADSTAFINSICFLNPLAKGSFISYSITHEQQKSDNYWLN